MENKTQKGKRKEKKRIKKLLISDQIKKKMTHTGSFSESECEES